MTDPTPTDYASAIEDLRARQAAAPAPLERPSPDRAADDALAAARLAVLSWERTVPLEFHDAHLSGLLGVPGFDALVEWTTGGWHHTNLVLLGATGVGKSWAVAAVTRAAFDHQLPAVAWWSAPELVDALHWEQPDHRARLAATQATTLLVVDDLGAEGANDWTQRQWFRIFEQRHSRRLATAVTTNLEPPDLAAAIGERSYSRLVGGATVVRLTGPDRRRA